MLKLQLSEVAKLFGFSQPFNGEINGISINTRTIETGNLFFAIRGPNNDGHQYLEHAKQQGAVAAIVEEKMPVDIPQILVTNTTQALGQVTHYWRKKFDIPFIGITGSNGKTTTKNMIQTICIEHLGAEHVLASEKNYNNEWGLPITLAQLESQHQVAVLEMGMNHFHEIERIASVAKPLAVAIITNIGPSHLEFVKDLQGVAEAKSEIFTGLNDDSFVILNTDDLYFNYLHDKVSQRCLTFGIKNPSHIHAEIISQTATENIFELFYGEQALTISLPLPGQHNIMNALAATAACITFDIPLDTIKRGLEKTKPEAHRLCLFKGHNGAQIIDDSYNASLSSVKAACDVLAQHQGRKIFVFGQMGELGIHAQAHHTQAGECMRRAGINAIYTFGEQTKHTVSAFAGDGFYFEDKQALIYALQQELNSNTVVLVKGSLASGMKQVVDAIVEPVAVS